MTDITCTERPATELQDTLWSRQAVRRALDVLDAARTGGGEAVVSQLSKDGHYLSELADDGSFSFVDGVDVPYAPVHQFSPEATQALFAFWSTLSCEQIIRRAEEHRARVQQDAERIEQAYTECRAASPTEARTLEPYACLTHSPGLDGTEGLTNVPKLRTVNDRLEIRIDGNNEGEWEAVTGVFRPAGQPVVVLALTEQVVIMHEAEFSRQV